MHRVTGAWSFLYSAVCLLVLYGWLSPTPLIHAQAAPGIGAGSNPEAESRREPFKIKLSGFLNTRPEDESTPVVTLGISTYRETYQFEVINVEAPDYPRLSSSIILQQVGRHSVDFDLFGPRELLSKIGQAEPGTPFAITGLYSPRNRSLRLESVDVIGMDKY
jgi:hypothetical protein